MNISEFIRNGKLQLFLALLVLVSAYIFLYLHISSVSVIFDGDEFNHAAPALDFLIYLKEGNWTGLIDRISREAFYPPLFPILLSPIYYIFGVSDVVARNFSLVLYFFAIIVTALAAYKISLFELKDSRAGNLAASTVIFLGITAWYPVLNSALCMVESLGVLLMASLILLIFSGQRRYDSTASALIIAFIGILLFFTKYTFLILLLPGLFLAILSCARDKKSLKSAIKFISVVCFAAFLAAFSWYLFADRTQINYFLFDYPLRGYTFGLKPLLFYPKVILGKGFYHSIIGVLFIILIGLSLRGSWNKVWFRASILIIVCSIQGFAMIFERQLRHILPIIPCLWLLCSYALANFCYGEDNLRSNLERFFNRLSNPKPRSARFDIRGVMLIPLFLLVVGLGLTNKKGIRNAMIVFMEYHPIVNAAITNITAKIRPCCQYTTGGDQFGEWFYYLDWHAAKQSMITIKEASKKRITHDNSQSHKNN